MPEEDVQNKLSSDYCLNQIRRAISAIPMPFAVYDENDRLILASDMSMDMMSDLLEGKDPDLAVTHISFEDAVRAFYFKKFPADVANKFLGKELERQANRWSGIRDINNDGVWIRRTRSVADTGQTVSITISIDELIKKTTALSEAKQQLEHLAFHDPLTGLPNRRGLSEHLQQLSSIPEAETYNVAVLHVDLDKFKLVNDTLGHDAGDAVLSKAASILRGEVRDKDIVARVGGDEFVVVCHHVRDEDGIAACAQRIVDRMADPIEYGEEYCQIGASIGIAITSAHNISEHVLMDADIALYEAKKKGRGRYEFFFPSFRDRYSTMQRRINQVRDAVKLNAFEPYYQPQISLKSGEIVGMEALARWNDREYGIRLPEYFLPAIEEARLSEALDDMMMRKILRNIRVWKDDGLDIPQVSLNLSEARLRQDNLVDILQWSLDDEGLTHDCIGLEVLEKVVAGTGSEDVIKNINRLSHAGFKITLDDFGTGNAPIAGLRNIALDTIKIDPSFSCGLEQDPELQTITSAMISLIKNLKMVPICEGVETKAQLEVLESFGVDIVQGYVFAKPMAADFVPIWMQAYADDCGALRRMA